MHTHIFFFIIEIFFAIIYSASIFNLQFLSKYFYTKKSNA